MKMDRPQELGDGRWLLVGGVVLKNVHKSYQCRGEYCCIHNPSNHRMRTWTMILGVNMLRICEHDDFHIDPDDPGWTPDCHCECQCCSRPSNFIVV